MPGIPPGMNNPKGADGTSESPDVELVPGHGSHDIARDYKGENAPLNEQGWKMDCKTIFHPGTT